MTAVSTAVIFLVDVIQSPVVTLGTHRILWDFLFLDDIDGLVTGHFRSFLVGILQFTSLVLQSCHKPEDVCHSSVTVVNG